MQPSLYEKYNYTELYQTCIDAGILVKPNEPAENMIACLEGWQEPPQYTEADNVFHTWRHGFINFLLEYWQKIETQIVCPAKALKDPINPNPRPCFGCIDAQVVTCIVTNAENEQLIQAHRLVRRPKNS